MPRSIKLFLECAPFVGAPGAINAVLEEELRGAGWSVDGCYGYRLSDRDRLLPFASAARAHRLDSAPAADVALYCDIGLAIRPPRAGRGEKTVVLFHGLVGEPNVWLGNPLVDRYCALSDYVRDVLQSLLAHPDWTRRRCLDPRAFGVVDSVVAPLPCVEHEDGVAEMPGEDLPEALLRELEKDDVVGHALQPRKADWRAVFRVLFHLNERGRARGARGRFRLVVSVEDYESIRGALESGHPMGELPTLLAALDFTLDDLLIPAPHLNQAALFRLFRAAKFGLAYNAFPEYFGMYVLESVFQGCPVYTNGAGNNRYTLPPEHGIRVLDGPDMVFGALDGYAPVAERILDDLAAPAGVRAACRRGREHIARTYTRAAFAASVGLALDRALSGAIVEATPFDDLRVALAPVVRSYDRASGRIVSDYVSARLDARSVALVDEVLGRRAGDIRPGEVESGRLQALFDDAVLTLRPSVAS